MAPHQTPSFGVDAGDCPALLECQCACDITASDGTIVDRWCLGYCTLKRRDLSPSQRCVHPGCSDANKVAGVDEGVFAGNGAATDETIEAEFQLDFILDNK